jgi:hypothetical protein
MKIPGAMSGNIELTRVIAYVHCFRNPCIAASTPALLPDTHALLPDTHALLPGTHESRSGRARNHIRSKTAPEQTIFQGDFDLPVGGQMNFLICPHRNAILLVPVISGCAGGFAGFCAQHAIVLQLNMKVRSLPENKEECGRFNIDGVHALKIMQGRA